MVGKPRERRTVSNLTRRTKSDINTLYSIKTRNKIVQTVGIAPTGSGGSAGGGAFLPITGGTMSGVIGSQAASLAISSGDLDLTQISTGEKIREHGIIFVSPESGNTDTLDTITVSNNFPPGGRILLVGTATRTITVTHESGTGSGLTREITFDSGTDAVITDTETLELFYDVVEDKFHATTGFGIFANKELDNLGTTAVNADINMEGNALVLDADKDTKIQAGTDDVMQMTVGASVRMSLSNSSIALTLPFSTKIDLNGNDLDNADTVISSASNPAATGFVRIGSGESIAWRNNGNTADLTISAGVSDDLVIGSNWNSVDLTGVGIDNIGSLTSNDADPADTGFIRMGNGEFIAWEADPASTDGLLTFNSSERFQFSDNPLVPTLDGGTSLGVSGLRWSTLWTNSIDASNALTVGGDTIMNGNVNIGNQDSDILTLRGEFDLSDISEPSSPASGKVTMFVDSADGEIKVKKSSGTVVSLEGGGGGTSDKIEEGDSKVEVIDPGTGQVDVFVDDLAVAKYRFSETALHPVVDADQLELGESALPWHVFFVKSIEIETGGTVTSNKNEIVSDSGGMVLNVPSGDRFEFAINGNVTNGGVFIDEDEIGFGTSGRLHSIVATGTSINIIAENTSDSVELWPGSSRSNEGLLVGDSTSIFKNSTSGSAYQLLIQYSNATTTGQPAIGNIGFQAEDSANTQSAYAGIVTAIDDDTSTGRDGRMQLVVANNDGTTERSVTALTGIGMDIQSDSGTMKLGFFGATPVAKPNPSVTAAAIHSALQDLGLFA